MSDSFLSMQLVRSAGVTIGRMNSQRVKQRLIPSGVVALPILAFSMLTWILEPAHSGSVRDVALVSLPVSFVLGHLVLIVLRLKSRPSEALRVVSVIFLSLDALLVLLLCVVLLLSTPGVDLESQFLCGMCMFLLLPAIVLGLGLLLVYVKRSMSQGGRRRFGNSFC